MTQEEIEAEAKKLFDDTMSQIYEANDDLARRMALAGQKPPEWGIVTNLDAVKQSIFDGKPIRYECKAVPTLTMTGEQN
jgi:hypothetical protein